MAFDVTLEQLSEEDDYEDYLSFFGSISTRKVCVEEWVTLFWREDSTKIMEEEAMVGSVGHDYPKLQKDVISETSSMLSSEVVESVFKPSYDALMGQLPIYPPTARPAPSFIPTTPQLMTEGWNTRGRVPAPLPYETANY